MENGGAKPAEECICTWEYGEELDGYVQESMDCVRVLNIDCWADHPETEEE